MIKKFSSHYRLQRFLRRLRPYMPARPRWKRILARQTISVPKSTGKKVLIATGTGSHWAMSGFESVLAAALHLRGADIDILLCDGVLPACQECDVRLFPKDTLLKTGSRPLCATCFKPAKAMFSELPVTVLKYSNWLLEEDRLQVELIAANTANEDIQNLSWRGISVGEHALAGALRFLGRGDIHNEPHGFAIVRQYFRAALLTVAILQRLLKSRQYDVAVFHHGIYIPQGIVGEVCRQHNIAVVNWNPAYRDRTYLFSHYNTYHKTMIEEPCSVWETPNMNDVQEQVVMNYLESRRKGSNDWISFQRDQAFSEIDFQQLGLDSKKPIIGLLTNVMWDAQLHFQHNAFHSMLEWLLFTIRYFTQRQDLQLLIRIHPAEVLGTVPSRQRVENEINRCFQSLPNTIFVVNADSPLDTYALMRRCDTVLVYGTKMAIELPCWGIPVVIAGEAWARGKGFTQDVSSKEEYTHVLDALPKCALLDEKLVKRARQYAYHLFYRRMIPVNFAYRYPHLVSFAYDVESMSKLNPSQDVGLDIICEGILTGKPFIFNRVEA